MYAPFSQKFQDPSNNGYTRQMSFTPKNFATPNEIGHANRLNQQAYNNKIPQPIPPIPQLPQNHNVFPIERFNNIYSQYPNYNNSYNNNIPQPVIYNPPPQALNNCNCQKNDNHIILLLLIIIGLLLFKK